MVGLVIGGLLTVLGTGAFIWAALLLAGVFRTVLRLPGSPLGAALGAALWTTLVRTAHWRAFLAATLTLGLTLIRTALGAASMVVQVRATSRGHAVIVRSRITLWWLTLRWLTLATLVLTRLALPRMTLGSVGHHAITRATLALLISRATIRSLALGLVTSSTAIWMSWRLRMRYLGR